MSRSASLPTVSICHLARRSTRAAFAPIGDITGLRGDGCRWTLPVRARQHARSAALMGVLEAAAHRRRRAARAEGVARGRLPGAHGSGHEGARRSSSRSACACTSGTGWRSSTATSSRPSSWSRSGCSIDTRTPPIVRHMGELLTVTILGGACFGLPTIDGQRPRARRVAAVPPDPGADLQRRRQHRLRPLPAAADRRPGAARARDADRHARADAIRSACSSRSRASRSRSSGSAWSSRRWRTTCRRCRRWGSASSCRC